AKADMGRAESMLAQDAALGESKREGRVVANGADVAEMVGKTLELSHERAEPDGAIRNLDLERRLDGLRKGEPVGDGTVPRCPPRELRPLVEAGSGHERVGALVHVAEPLLEPHHRLAIGREAKMPRLDDAGMDRPDRDLM